MGTFLRRSLYLAHILYSKVKYFSPEHTIIHDTALQEQRGLRDLLKDQLGLNPKPADH